MLIIKRILFLKLGKASFYHNLCFLHKFAVKSFIFAVCNCCGFFFLKTKIRGWWLIRALCLICYIIIYYLTCTISLISVSTKIGTPQKIISWYLFEILQKTCFKTKQQLLRYIRTVHCNAKEHVTVLFWLRYILL